MNEPIPPARNDRPVQLELPFYSGMDKPASLGLSRGQSVEPSRKTPCPESGSNPLLLQPEAQAVEISTPQTPKDNPCN